MRAKLFRAGADRGTSHEFSERATIGRGAEATIRLEADAVSTEHARVWFDPEIGRYRIEDLGSLNGTRLDGVALARAEPLDRLHVVEFGGDGSEYVLQIVDVSPGDAETEDVPVEPDSAEAEIRAAGTAADQEMPELPAALAADDDAGEPGAPAAGTSVDREMPALPEDLLDEEAEETLPLPAPEAAEPAPEPVPTGSTTRGRAPFYLRLHEPPDSEPHPLYPGNRVVGRARSADVTVESRAVSRRHAMLTVTPEAVTVQDLGSRNQTFAGDRPVTEPTEIKPGEVIRFGELAATLLAGDPEQ